MRFESWMPFIPLHRRCKLYNPPTPLSVKMKLTIIRYFDFYSFYASPMNFISFSAHLKRGQNFDRLFRKRTLKLFSIKSQGKNYNKKYFNFLISSYVPQRFSYTHRKSISRSRKFPFDFSNTLDQRRRKG